jgi:hypothetical protein
VPRPATHRYAMAHEYGASMWRASLGDAADADARMREFERLGASLPPRQGVPTTYAGADPEHPTTTLYPRHLAARSSGAPRPVTFQAPSGVSAAAAVAAARARSQPGAVPQPLNGQLLAVHSAAVLAGADPKRLAELLAAAGVPDNVATAPLLLPLGTHRGAHHGHNGKRWPKQQRRG